jgi:hypothetical protein
MKSPKLRVRLRRAWEELRRTDESDARVAQEAWDWIMKDRPQLNLPPEAFSGTPDSRLE